MRNLKCFSLAKSSIDKKKKKLLKIGQLSEFGQVEPESDSCDSLLLQLTLVI
jgi:hypothetical protein